MATNRLGSKSLIRFTDSPMSLWTSLYVAFRCGGLSAMFPITGIYDQCERWLKIARVVTEMPRSFLGLFTPHVHCLPVDRQSSVHISDSKSICQAENMSQPGGTGKAIPSLAKKPDQSKGSGQKLKFVPTLPPRRVKPCVCVQKYKTRPKII